MIEISLHEGPIRRQLDYFWTYCWFKLNV